MITREMIENTEAHKELVALGWRFCEVFANRKIKYKSNTNEYITIETDIRYLEIQTETPTYYSGICFYGLELIANLLEELGL